MSTWQIFSDSGNNFRWEQLHIEPTEEPKAVQTQRPRRLSSMPNLLLQGYSKMIEIGGINHEESSPMFRTGLGKSVVVNQSSLSKASSILRDEVNVMADRGCSKITKNGGGHVESPSMFQTGLGNSVVVKQLSLSKALSILNDECDDTTD